MFKQLPLVVVLIITSTVQASENENDNNNVPLGLKIKTLKQAFLGNKKLDNTRLELIRNPHVHKIAINTKLAQSKKYKQAAERDALYKKYTSEKDASTDIRPLKDCFR